MTRHAVNRRPPESLGPHVDSLSFFLATLSGLGHIEVMDNKTRKALASVDAAIGALLAKGTAMVEAAKAKASLVASGEDTAAVHEAGWICNNLRNGSAMVRVAIQATHIISNCEGNVAEIENCLASRAETCLYDTGSTNQDTNMSKLEEAKHWTRILVVVTGFMARAH